ncbi:MAG: sigma-54 dependent transcriptional regulator [Planctomycetes bacterium]|nr:sigma-54 dependent transcriptional regulator [Planctomycetota bacterium]
MAGRCQAPFEREARLCRVCRLDPEVEGLKRCSRLVAESPAMKEVMVRAARFARSDASVVILGESGAGKEVLARALHANGPRRSGPFIPVNVAALPAELLESELFGHVKGAFTGAVSDKRGLMEAAAGGTLFLDEVAEMPLPLQAKLLRALQDGEVRRVGDVRPFTADVRVVCATHRDLARRVEQGLFREDLYYRLKVFTLRVPPLRERREDVLPLAAQLLDVAGRPGVRFTRAAARALEEHRWPGNVRELQNAITHALALADGGEVDVEHLPDEVTGQAPSRAPAEDGGALRTLAEVEQAHVLRVLEACGGRQAEAARLLGVGRTTLWRKLRGYGLT